MKALVGYTGFVGGNIDLNGDFQYRFNSKNIEEAYGTEPDLLVYAGIRAEMFLANKFPEKDYESILEAENNIKKINPKKLVLISTVDVYDKKENVNEDHEINIEDCTPYGRNRLKLERWVEENINDYSIIRLPALFGKGIKKNFIYDYINVIPKLLTDEKFSDLSIKNEILKRYYKKREDGFWELVDIVESERTELKKVFKSLGFTALNFTDSRAEFQFYNLYHLWDDIKKVTDANIRKINMVTEPLQADKLYEYLANKSFANELNADVRKYNIKTKHDEVFGCTDGYINTAEETMKEIKRFIDEKKY